MNLPSVAVIVTCHPTYIKYLEKALVAVDEQTMTPRKKILVCDGFEYGDRDGWQIVSGDWKNPSKARNAALDLVNEEWVVFADADNEMQPTHVAMLAMEAKKAHFKVGIIYPNIIRLMNNKITWSKRAPKWSYWLLRRKNFIDSSSIWRTEAVKSVKWNVLPDRFDDYALALRITKQGWEAAPAVDVFSQLVQHGENRSNRFQIQSQALWDSSDMTVVMLYSGRKVAKQTLNWLVEETFPRDTRFVFVIDGEGFPYDNIMKTIGTTNEVVFKQAIPNTRKHDTFLTEWERKHYRVADLYNQALNDIRSALVMTIEDDVVPPKGAVKQMALNVLSMTNIKIAVSGVYESRSMKDHACYSTDESKWTGAPKLSDVPREFHKVGMIPGGFSIYQSWILQACLPLSVERNPALGWDGTLSKRFKKLGYDVFVDGQIVCKHNID